MNYANKSYYLKAKSSIEMTPTLKKYGGEIHSVKNFTPSKKE